MQFLVASMGRCIATQRARQFSIKGGAKREAQASSLSHHFVGFVRRRRPAVAALRLRHARGFDPNATQFLLASGQIAVLVVYVVQLVDGAFITPLLLCKEEKTWTTPNVTRILGVHQNLTRKT